MKKDDFKKLIDYIAPDPYLENRLKAKILFRSIPAKRGRQVGLTASVAFLTLAIAFHSFWLSLPKSSTEQQESDLISGLPNQAVTAFLTLTAYNAEASASEAVGSTLMLGEAHPYEVYLKVKSTRGLSDAEKWKIKQELQEDFSNYCAEKKLDVGRAMVCEKEDMTLSQYSFHEFKLNLEDPAKVKRIRVKNSSKYGQIVYNRNKPIFSAPEHGHELSFDGEKFDFEGSGFYWEHTEEMEKAFQQNIALPFSTFNDTITFTVEHQDGSKAVGRIDLVFQEDGSAVAVCTGYDLLSEDAEKTARPTTISVKG